MLHMLSIFAIHILPCGCAYNSIKDLEILEDFNIFKMAYEKIQDEDFNNINIVPLYSRYSFNDEEAERYDYILFRISEQKNIKHIKNVEINWEKDKTEKIMGRSNMNYRYRIPSSVSLNFRDEMEKPEQKKQCKYAVVDLCGKDVSPYILLDDQVRILIQLIEEYHKSKEMALHNHLKNNTC